MTRTNKILAIAGLVLNAAGIAWLLMLWPASVMLHSDFALIPMPRAPVGVLAAGFALQVIALVRS